MDSIIITLKNICYIVIIFTILEKIMLVKKDNTVIRYIAGLIVIITIVSPIFEMIDLVDGDKLTDKIMNLIDISLNDEEITQIIEENSNKATQRIVQEAKGGRE